jgi:malonate-semialdehyde dehydrogenase (acetylating)/methylmalonate-semialdehyde dehydrogenase
MAASVLVAVGDVDHLLSAIVERTKQMELGPDMGALIDKASYSRLTDAIAKAESEGVKVLVDGRKAKAPAGYEDGYWLAPTILDGAKPGQDCATRELFGPVLTIVRVDTLDEALDFAVSTDYGNATSVFTTRGAVARHVVDRATAGMVGVNIGVPVPREPFSFGGTRDSRFGVGDITGPGGVEFWSFTKKVTTKYALQSDHNWMS